MNHYVTGNVIRQLREQAKLTQAQLAEKLCVSDKAVSKWETGRGLPDISLLEPLAECLGISVPELLSGQPIRNQNKSANILRSRFYVCPVCGNVLWAAGEALISCCGIALPALEAEEPEEAHLAQVETVEDELLVILPHPMTREHHIRFIAYVTSDRTELVRLYPEGAAQARFLNRGRGKFFWCCNRHGLYTAHYGRKPKT